MSDGDNATPGQHRAPDSGEERISRAPRPASGSAPWERAAASRPAPSGNHTEGVTVADLIAKVGGTPKPTRRRVAAPQPDNSTDRTEPIPVIPVAYADEIPEMEYEGLQEFKGPRKGSVERPLILTKAKEGEDRGVEERFETLAQEPAGRFRQ